MVHVASPATFGTIVENISPEIVMFWGMMPACVRKKPLTTARSRSVSAGRVQTLPTRASTPTLVSLVPMLLIMAGAPTDETTFARSLTRSDPCAPSAIASGASLGGSGNERVSVAAGTVNAETALPTGLLAGPSAPHA